MSKDPKQDPKTGKTSPKPSKPSIEATEADLWDLDSNISDNSEIEATETRTPEAIESLPERRELASNIQSRKPTKRKTDVPSVVPTEKSEETEKKEVPKPAPEAKPESISAEEAPEIPDSGDPVASALIPSFTKIERIAIASLFGVLLLAAGMTVSYLSNRVPTRPIIAEKPDFPISGKLVEIRSASTYWRKPVTTGEKADTVRRGTVLIPILQVSVNTKPCTIRVFFRDQDGIVIGDAINRKVSGDKDLTIPATAGFDDIGMHAAYRTGDQLPWTVHILEGPSSGGEREDFKEILKIHISTDVH